MSSFTQRSWSWRSVASLLLFTALLALFVFQDPTEARERPWRGPHVTEDGWYYYHWLRSGVLDGDLDLHNDYREFGNWYGFGVTATGRPHNPFGIGPALLWAPGFTIGHGIATLCADGSTGSVADGYSRAEQTGALLTSFLAAIGACGFAFALCRRFVNPSAAWLGTALAFFAGPVVWYALFSPSMPHAFEAFFGAAFLWLLLTQRERTGRGAMLLGLVAGGMMLVRPQLGVFLVLPLVETVQALRRRYAGGDTVKPPLLQFAAVLGVAAVVFFPQLCVWKWTYGSWLVVPQSSGFLRFADSLWSETLFSSRNGLFTVTPMLWFVMPGLYVLGRRHKQLAFALALLLLMQAVVNGAAWDWWAGGAFGGRRFAATFPVWAMALSALCARLSVPGRVRGLRIGLAVGGALALLVLQGCMLSAHHRHRLPWDAPLPFGRRVHIATGLSVLDQQAVGAPFAFPANALFALQHGVPLSRYERAVGPYLLDERLPTTNPLLPRKRSETVTLSDGAAIAFYGRGFIRSARGAELSGTPGELLLPLNRPGSFTLQVETLGLVDDEIEWTFNGRTLTQPSEAETAEGRLSFFIDGGWVARGINVLRVDSGAIAGSLVLRSLRLEEGDEWPPAWATVYGL
ncbi:MAG TPA: hypothetical protein VHO25_23950 [Polyangiaceae bacterium]|nr:hypothetical protein [Polyangiaceae bacterium]